MHKETLQLAVQAALDGDWHTAHNIAQNDNSDTAHWLHAVLHKIEGDEWNSKYWYARTDTKKYEDFADASAELNAIQQHLKP